MFKLDLVPVCLALAAAGPGGSVVVLTGKGAQIYACAVSPQGYAWRLKAPDAVLTDDTGRAVGRHFAGPTWRAQDGSTIVGQVVASGAAPSPGAVPWLVLTARTNTGSGVFAGIGTVVRSATQGGAAPATGCDAAHAGQEKRVAYSATYSFFPR